MTSKAAFSSEEWTLLTSVMRSVGLAVMHAADSGTIGTAKEMIALWQATKEGDVLFPSNDIIRALVQDYAQEEATGGGLVTDRAHRISAGLDDTVATCVAAAELLSRKATTSESDEFKQWMLFIGTQVADAAKEGGVFSVAASRISFAENHVLTAIATALGVPTN